MTIEEIEANGFRFVQGRPIKDINYKFFECTYISRKKPITRACDPYTTIIGCTIIYSKDINVLSVEVTLITENENVEISLGKHTIYIGQCNSIEEFDQIFKLLQIDYI